MQLVHIIALCFKIVTRYKIEEFSNYDNLMHECTYKCTTKQPFRSWYLSRWPFLK